MDTDDSYGSKGMEGIIHRKKIKFPINDFFSKCDQIRSFLRIWSHLPKKSLRENFIFCAVQEIDSCDSEYLIAIEIIKFCGSLS